MHQYSEINGEEYRKPGGKTHIIEILNNTGLRVEDVLDRAKWKTYIQNHSGDPR